MVFNPVRATPWLGYLLAVIFFILFVVLFISGWGERKAGVSLPPAGVVIPAETEDVVRFTSTLNLAKRMGADLGSLPLFRAAVGQPIDQSVEFKVATAGAYRLVLQMTDSAFVDQRQATGEYLEVVREDQAVGQTFTVRPETARFGGLRVKLEARGITTGQPAETPPDAPMTATLYTNNQEKIGEVILPVEQAGLNDAWRWVTIPFDVALPAGRGRTFFMEFTSPATVVGWALSRVSNGFNNVDDHYQGGELLLNGQPPKEGARADLEFEVLARSSETKQPRILVDETVLTFTSLPETKDWLFSEPVDLSEGAHVLIVQSSNPHLSFFRFIFVPESEGAQSFKNQLEAGSGTVLEEDLPQTPEESPAPDTSEPAASTPSPTPSDATIDDAARE